MKKWLLLIFILIIPVLIYADTILLILPVPSGAACDTVEGSCIVYDGDVSCGNATIYWVGNCIIDLSSSYTICKAKFYISETGDISAKTMNVDVYTYDETNKDIETELGRSDNVSGSLVTSSKQWIEFTFSTPVSLTAGNDYAIAITTNDNDASNYLLVAHSNNDNCTAEGYLRYWNTDKTNAGGIAASDVNHYFYK